MAKTTKRITFERTITYRYTADMPNFAAETDASALAAANLPGGINSIGELLAGAPAANGVIARSNWSVQSAGVAIEPYTIFVPGYDCKVGLRFVSATSPNSRLYVCYIPGLASTGEPAWSDVVGATVTSRQASFMTIDKFAAPIAFATSAAYTPGVIIKPAPGSTAEYLVVAGGISGSSAPSWPGTVGTTVVSGGVSMICVSV